MTMGSDSSGDVRQRRGSSGDGGRPTTDAARVDLVIVGAGAAGLAAADTARELGLDFAMLEAAPHVGGRAHTDTETFGFPWDRGAHWLHSADTNPFTKLADGHGFRYRRDPQPQRLRLTKAGRWADKAEQDEAMGFVERGYAAAEKAGDAGRDVAYSEVVEREDRWFGAFDAAVAEEFGVNTDRGSTLDYASYEDTGRNWPVWDGYGALVVRHGADLPVSLSTPVERVDWDEGGVRVTTPRGEFSAGAAILTVSTGVLAGGSIFFSPELPGWKRDAVEGLPMGKVNKVAILFDRDVFGIEEDTYVVVTGGEPRTLTFEIRPSGRDFAVGYVSGRLCDEMEEAGEAAMVEFALAHLKEMFGAGIERHVSKTACTLWGSDPFVRGAYSAALPGKAHLRADLARPLKDVLFFAGEAASVGSFSTVHGARRTGVDAAQAAARALARTGGR